MKSVDWRRWLSQILVAALVAAMVSQGRDLPWASTVRAEPRRVTAQSPDEHFKSGGRLSETVLQEMLTVLKRIDERLERLEKVAVPTIGVAPAGDLLPGNIGAGSGQTGSRQSAPLPAIQVRRGS